MEQSVCQFWLAQNATSQSRGGWHPSRAVISFPPPSQNYPVWFQNPPPEGVHAGISLFPEIKSFGMAALRCPRVAHVAHPSPLPFSCSWKRISRISISKGYQYQILIPLGWRFGDGEEGLYLIFIGIPPMLWNRDGSCAPSPGRKFPLLLQPLGNLQ